MLSSFLDKSKLGLERRAILQWTRETAEGKIRVLNPGTLLALSPNAGLTNQVFSLVGACQLANLSDSALMLPMFTAGKDVAAIPFTAIFEAAHFAHTMRPALSLAHSSQRAARGLHTLGHDRGWLLYKAYQDLLGYERAVHTRSALRTRLELIEHLVLVALRPSRVIHHWARMLRIALLGHVPYGCLHTRIERDMRRDVRYNQAGQPPSIHDYLSLGGVAMAETVRSTRRIFVPVSLSDFPCDFFDTHSPCACMQSADRHVHRPCCRSASTYEHPMQRD